VYIIVLVGNICRYKRNMNLLVKKDRFGSFASRLSAPRITHKWKCTIINGTITSDVLVECRSPHGNSIMDANFQNKSENGLQNTVLFSVT
jgi:hypothetical protein